MGVISRVCEDLVETHPDEAPDRLPPTLGETAPSRHDIRLREDLVAIFLGAPHRGGSTDQQEGQCHSTQRPNE